MNAAKRPVMPPLTSATSSPFQVASTQIASSSNAPVQASVQKSALRVSGSLGNGSQRRSVKRVPYSGMRQAIAFESSVKLTVNLLLAIVATTTMAKLWPYYQSQYNRLTMLQESVEVAEQKNAELRSQFSSNFDPAQAARIMQEQSGLTYPNQKKVIWQNSPQSPQSP